MKIYWNTLNSRIRAVIVFLALFLASQIFFWVTGGNFDTMDLLIGFYVGGFGVYFLSRWGFFAIRAAMVLPNQEFTTYEKLRKNPGRRRHGPAEPPEFIDAEEADDELMADDRVLGAYFNGEAAAYPLAALGVREVSNEEYDDVPVVISWSPVTYSARGFIAKPGDGTPVNLGRHTHTIFNSPVMPDENESAFIQFIGQAVSGALTGWTLEQIPVITTTWAAWKQSYPDTEVMSTVGGPESDMFERYYANDRNGIHNMPPKDKRLHGKDVVLGLDIKGEARAYSYSGLIETPVVEEELGREPIVVLHERSSSTAVAFSRTVDGRTLSFKGQSKNPHRRSIESTASGEGEREDYEPWLIEDTQTGSTWRAISGECIEGEFKGSRLNMLTGMTGFWYTWSRFYPGSSLFGAIEETTNQPTE